MKEILKNFWNILNNFKNWWKEFLDTAFSLLIIPFLTLGVFVAMYILSAYLGNNLEPVFNATKSIDPLAFIGTVIVGIGTLVLFFKQNEIAKTALEQNRPMLNIVGASKRLFQEKYNIPQIKIKNTGASELINLNIYFTYKNDIDTDTFPLIHSVKNSGISIDPQQEYALQIEESDAEKYQSIFVIYQNLLTKRYYLYATNIAIYSGASFHLSPIGIEDIKLKENISPISIKDYQKIRKEFSQNVYNAKYIKNFSKNIMNLLKG